MFDSLRLLAHAGAPCPESVKRATMARARPGVVWEFYGSTEAQYTVCSPDDWLEHPGTVGRARTGRRLSIAPVEDHDHGLDGVDKAAALVDVGEGAIWCDQPEFARFSYWRNPEATAEAWRGSACTVGDLGRLDVNGFLYLTGRRHDLIISGGVNVYLAEVENVLSAVPGVSEVAVFGLPDEQWASVSAPPTSPAPPPRPLPPSKSRCARPPLCVSPRTSVPRITLPPATCRTQPPAS